MTSLVLPVKHNDMHIILFIPKAYDNESNNPNDMEMLF